jgi:hypothetical protein
VTTRIWVSLGSIFDCGPALLLGDPFHELFPNFRNWPERSKEFFRAKPEQLYPVEYCAGPPLQGSDMHGISVQVFRWRADGFLFHLHCSAMFHVEQFGRDEAESEMLHVEQKEVQSPIRVCLQTQSKTGTSS